MNGFDNIPEPTDGAAWVTGASSGIGRALAIKLAEEGWVVYATARGAEKLQALAEEHPNIRPAPGDVRDAAAMRAIVDRICDEAGLGLAVLNAGIYNPMRAPEFDAAKAAQTYAVNLEGVSNCLEPVLQLFWRRRSGCVGLVASVAGYRGLPRAAPYAATKAGLRALAESLAFDLAPRGVRIALINPGFVNTDAVGVNDFDMPFLMEPATAAARIVKGLRRPGFEISFPRRFVLILKTLRLLPPRTYFWLVSKSIGWSKVMRREDG